MFLLRRGHPLRGVVAELGMRAAVAGAWDPGAEHEFARLLEGAVRDFDLNASFVLPTLSRLEPLALDVIKTFLEQLQAERDERGSVLLAQECVCGEIERRLRGAELDPLLR
jgi:hypothetical protein